MCVCVLSSHFVLCANCRFIFVWRLVTRCTLFPSGWCFLPCDYWLDGVLTSAYVRIQSNQSINSFGTYQYPPSAKRAGLVELQKLFNFSNIGEISGHNVGHFYTGHASRLERIAPKLHSRVTRVTPRPLQSMVVGMKRRGPAEEPAEAATMLRLSHVSRWPAVTASALLCLIFHERRRLQKEGLTVLLIGCIPVHKIHLSPTTSFTADLCQLYGRGHATAALVRRHDPCNAICTHEVQDNWLCSRQVILKTVFSKTAIAAPVDVVCRCCAAVPHTTY